MYSGHVLGIAAVFQALTGDDRFARDGFSTTIPPGLPRAGTQHTTTTLQLAERIAGAMVRNKSGGMTCEPGLYPVQQPPAHRLPHAGADVSDQQQGQGQGQGRERGRRGRRFLGSARALGALHPSQHALAHRQRRPEDLRALAHRSLVLRPLHPLRPPRLRRLVAGVLPPLGGPPRPRQDHVDGRDEEGACGFLHS